MKENYFKQQLGIVIQYEEALQKKFNTISSIRFILFVVSILCFIIGFYQKLKVGYLTGILGLLIFSIFVYFHNKVDSEKIFVSAKRKVLEKYLKRFNSEWKDFEYDGKEYLNDKFPQSKDLDLFGKASLYQYICAAHTFYGRDRLADSLLNSSLDKNKILKRQEAIKELVNKKDFSVDLEAMASLTDTKIKKEDLEKLFKYSESKSNLNLTLIKLCSWFPILLTLSCIILYKLDFLPIYILYMAVIVQIGIAFFGGMKFSSILSPLYNFSSSIKAYEKIILTLEKENFESNYLKQLQQNFVEDSKASKAIYILSSIVEATNLKYSPILYLFASITLMWDYQCVIALENWKKDYGNRIRNWFDTIGEIEDLMSFSVLYNTKENVCFPTILNQKSPKIEVLQISHPLIQETKAINNSINLNSRPCIITGSNMSGKTTFLRSIGLNMILCYAGSCVCAKSFETTCMSIFTSMRVEDNVSEGVSTFYAELLRIKSMIEYVPQKQPMLVLIDEIFKGTNSADRITGAKEVIKKLTKDWIIAIVTTHDFELCDLENDTGINAINYHFSEYYVENKIKFDYTIKNGRCTTTNAKQLMKMVGILN